MRYKKPALLISIPEPCTENWNGMEKRQAGKFCSACQKEVIDFSGYSEKELYAYFQHARRNQCGRFKNTQIDRFVYLSHGNSKITNNLFNRLAAILAIISLGPTPVRAESSVYPKLQIEALKYDDFKTEKTVTITGSVKNWQGIEVEGALVYLDSTLVTKSDSRGRFSFDLVAESPSKLYTVSIGYPEMVTVVRNYHPAMQSTSYDVVLRKQAAATDAPSHIVGGFSFNYIGLDSFALQFARSSTTIDNRCRNELSKLAALLRNHPNLVIEFTGYGRTLNEKVLLSKRIDAVIDYIVTNEGISDDRLKKKIEKGRFKDSNPIEIRPIN